MWHQDYYRIYCDDCFIIVGFLRALASSASLIRQPGGVAGTTVIVAIVWYLDAKSLALIAVHTLALSLRLLV